MDAPPTSNDLPLWALLTTLLVLVLLSAFFSASETAMMSLNRYRLRHRAESGDHRAQAALRMLQQPDRMLGTILLGNNLVNIAAASVATVIALRLFGEYAIAIATFLTTIIILVFAEVPPKTLAAMYPERIAYPVAPLLYRLQWLLRPLTLFTNIIGNALLRLPGVPMRTHGARLSASELRSAVLESGSLIPYAHRSMLLRILDLEGITVDDVMVPRKSIEAIDIGQERDTVVAKIKASRHYRVPIYEGSLDKIKGIMPLREALLLLNNDEYNDYEDEPWRAELLKILQQPYFIPEGSSLAVQLLQLQKQHHHVGLVIDEYGDTKGLVTTEELLEEIAGEFVDNVPDADEGITHCEDGAWLIEGGATIRDIKRTLEWELTTDGPRTLNGLLLEHLEDIPRIGTVVKIEGRPVEVLRTRGTAVVLTRVGELIPHENIESANRET